MYPYTQKNTAVAPPRGERGLKLRKSARLSRLSGRSPSWGAWIETRRYTQAAPFQTVAPPRGERGLKQAVQRIAIGRKRVAPPRGERGLKHFNR